MWILPLYLTWKASLSKNRKNYFYFSAGPYFAFIYGASQSYQNRVKQYNSSKYIYQSGTEDLPVGNGSRANIKPLISALLQKQDLNWGM